MTLYSERLIFGGKVKCKINTFLILAFFRFFTVFEVYPCCKFAPISKFKLPLPSNNFRCTPALLILKNVKQNKNSKIFKTNKQKCKNVTWTFLF